MMSIIGLGSVGNAALSTFKSHFKTYGYDIDGRGEWSRVLISKCAIVCVPTDGDGEGGLDMTNIFDVSERLDSSNYKGLIVLKSTLEPSTMDELNLKFPNLRFAYVPEFLREKDAIEWFNNPDRIVYSCRDTDESELLTYFGWVTDTVPRIRMSNLEAEFGKLAHNAYIATKVTFTCEIERLCTINAIDAEKVMQVVWSDRRVNNPAHLTPYLGGFSGKCVPKDTQALASCDPDVASLLHSLHERGGAENVQRRLDSL